MNYLIKMLLIRSDKRSLHIEKREKTFFKDLYFSFNVKKNGRLSLRIAVAL